MPQPENVNPSTSSRFGLVANRTGKLLNTIIFFLLLVTIVFTNVPYGTVDAWWEAFFECAVFALTIGWIVEALLLGQQFRSLSILLPLVLIVAYAFVQAIVWPVWWPAGIGRFTAQHTLSIDRYQTFLTARKGLALTLFLGLLLQHTSTPKRLSWLVRVIIGLGLASAVFGILRQFLQGPESQMSFVLPFLFPKMGYGQFIYHNAFAYLMEMSLAVLLGLVLGGGVRRDQVLIYLAIGLVIWAALVLSNSRGGIVGFACQSIFLLFTSLNWYSARRLESGDATPNKWLRFLENSVLVRSVAVALIVIALISGVLWMGGERFASRLQELSNQEEPVHGLSRTAVWKSTWLVIKQNPWSGVGFGNYFLAIPEFKTGSGLVKLEQAHNDYLDLVANGGVVALALALWFIAGVVWRGRKSLRSVDRYRRAAALGAVAGCLSVAVHSLVDFGLQVTGLAVVLAALIVIWVAGRAVERLPRRLNG